MGLVIEEIGADHYPLYDAIPIAYTVESVLRVDVVDGGLGGFRLVEEQLPAPYVKDYDRQGDDRPSAWAKEFDVSRWGILLARDEGQPIGGAAVAVGAGAYPLDRFQRPDLAVLWDIRVAPEARRQGVGRALFWQAASWAKEHGYGQLGLETQNVNLAACRFYARQGCQLGAIHRFGYAGLADVAHEAMLLWYLDLSEI
jgi:ribosomal protein S18 acetylase RimI-like enzyme